MVRLSRLVQRLGGELVQRVQDGWAGDPDIVDVELDSRSIATGALFCALTGTATDGRRFLRPALGRGAAAVLCTGLDDLAELQRGWRAEPRPGGGHRVAASALWLHPDPRRVTGPAASLVHGSPSSDMFTVGITGTNGKTSVAHLVHQLLARADLTPSLFGTVQRHVHGAEPVTADTTTPHAAWLHRALGRARVAGGRSAVLEVSSHAIHQHRVAGLAFDLGVFTNLSRDHLDYHGSLEEYAAVKASFFRALGSGARAIVNVGDAHGELMASAAREGGAEVVTYGVGSSADLVASRWECGPEGTRVVLEGMGISKTDLMIPLVGRHNVENALAAAAAALLSGASASTVVEGLASAAPPPGRLEPADPAGAARRGYRVLVDYAHTPDALASVLGALRETVQPGGRILCVFGCGGDRDRGKRPEMGAAVAAGADVAFLTSDNPRGEDPELILDQVEAGMTGATEVHRTADRRAAIAAAIAAARPGDVVLVAGKGHEQHQLVGGRVLEFDDRRVAEELLA